eukprot:gb/GECG01011790.1/.p1 GENE.gb/GECG01011790.1/~~gb/GECG01011790.1/.p1  ORF type:complete len:441 (+),score=34.29 gb/GECG01011790.1/:1-1323(+)
MEVGATNLSEQREGQLFWRPSVVSSHNKRRQQFLERQRQQRKDAHARLRTVVEASNQDDSATHSEENGGDDHDMTEGASGAAAAEGDGDILLDESGPTRKKPAHNNLVKRKAFVSHMSLPEWLIEVPQDLDGSGSLEEGWIVIPRPEGTHATLVAANSRTTIRDKHGLRLYIGTLNIPGGCPGSKGGSASVLDGIFHMRSKTFFAVDCLSWNGLPLWDCAAIVRRSWLLSNLTPLGNGATDLNSLSVISHRENTLALSVTPHYECSHDGILTAYKEQFSFNKDGLLFFQKAAPYGEGYVNPCVLQYKDSDCSRWCPTTASDSLIATLFCRSDGQLQCGDEVWDGSRVWAVRRITVFLIALQVTISNLAAGDAQPKRLVKCMYSDAQYVGDRQLHVQELRIVGPAGSRRIYADTSTKLVFNSNRRHQRPPDLAQILQYTKT